MKYKTPEQFDALTPWEKGYVVYMCGDRDDEPNVPSEYRPASEDAHQYDAGQFAAVLQVQDSEE
jgi:hypothetical protein